MTFLKPSQQEGRVTLTVAEKRLQFNRKWMEQGGRCFYCQCRLTREPEQFNTACREHVEPGKMGGCKDDSDKNIVLACWKCNMEKGSQRYALPKD